MVTYDNLIIINLYLLFFRDVEVEMQNLGKNLRQIPRMGKKITFFTILPDIPRLPP